MEIKKLLVTTLFLMGLASCASSHRTSTHSDQTQASEQAEQVVEEEKKSYGPSSPSKKPIVLVLGPGMARGFAYVGILRELEKNKIPVAAIVATEFGALIGSIYADSKNLNEFEWKLLRLKEDVFIPSGLSLSRLFNKPDDGSRLSKNLDQLFSKKQISEMNTPIRIGVFSLNDDVSEFPETGRIKDWIRASLAIDPVFTKTKVNQRTFRASIPEKAFPLEKALDLNLGSIVFVNLHSDLDELESSNQNELQYSQKMKNSIEQTKRTLGRADLILTPNLDGISYFDFKKRKTIEYRGKAEVQKYMKEIKKLIYEN